MSYKKSIERYINSLIAVLQSLDRTQIDRFIKALKEIRSAGKNIFIFGNGGSGSTASHVTGDFNKGCSYNKQKRFKVTCLNDNNATLLAYANDVSYEDVFFEQLKNFMEPGDLVIAISGSGNSKNIIKAIDYANENGALTIGLTGFDGGRLKEISQIVLHANINDMQKAEDIHLILNHIAMQILGRER